MLAGPKYSRRRSTITGQFGEGKDPAGNDLARSPVEVTPEVLARGPDRYRIWPISQADRRAIVAHVRQMQQQRQAEGATK